MKSKFIIYVISLTLSQKYLSEVENFRINNDFQMINSGFLTLKVHLFVSSLHDVIIFFEIFGDSYYERRIGNRTQAKRYHFQ